MKLKDFLNKLATVSGLNEDEEVSKLLENEALEIEVDDSINKLTGNLLTMDAAKNNRDLQDHFYKKIEGSIYGTFDEIANTFADKYEIDKTVFSEDDSTAKKLKTVLTKLGEKEGKTVIKKDNEEIERLHNEIQKLKEEKEEVVKQSQSEIKKNKLNFLATNKVLQQKLIDQIPGGREFLAKATIEQLSNKYHLNVNDNNEIEVKQKDDPTLDAYVNDKKATFDDLVKSHLDEGGFIKKNDGAGEPSRKREHKVDLDKKPKNLHDMIRAGKPTSL